MNVTLDRAETIADSGAPAAKRLWRRRAAGASTADLSRTRPRKIADEDLESLLKEHSEWLARRPSDESRRWGGLRGVELTSASVLQGEKPLTPLDLRFMDLTDTVLDHANLEGVKLTGSTLRGASLQFTNMKGACGLLEEELAGANLRGATLPETLMLGESLAKIADLSKNSGALFLSMLAGCAFSWLTIKTTSDAQLIANSANSNLPIIQSSIPVGTFYQIAPIILFAVYLYFQLSLLRLWETMALLPVIYPDGKTMDRKSYPWLINDLAGAFLRHVPAERPPLFWTQKVMTIILAWWVVPMTMLLFWWGYLHVHRADLTCLHVLLFIASVSVGYVFYRLSVATLRGDATLGDVAELADWHAPHRSSRTYKRAGAMTLLLVILGLFSLEALPFSVPQRVAFDTSHVMRFFLGTLLLSHQSPYWGTTNPLMQANLDYSSIPEKPDNWTGREHEIDLVKQTDLRNVDLFGVRAYHAFLVNANLQNAQLQKADLRFSQLQGTQLFNADLRDADLTGTHLEKANLQSADLRRANLSGADLTVAVVFKTDLARWRGVVYTQDTKWPDNLREIFGPHNGMAHKWGLIQAG